MEETLIEFQFEQLAKSQQVLSVGNAISQDFNWIWLELRAYSIYIHIYTRTYTLCKYVHIWWSSSREETELNLIIKCVWKLIIRNLSFSTSCVWLHPIIWRRTIPQWLSMSRMSMTIRPFSRDPRIVLKSPKRMIAICPSVCYRSLKTETKKNIRKLVAVCSCHFNDLFPISCCHCSSISFVSFVFVCSAFSMLLHMYVHEAYDTLPPQP